MTATAGFAGLTYLKARLLPEARRTDTDYDAPLKRLGLAVMARFDRHTNRTLASGTETTTTWANALVACVRNYPVTSVGACVVKGASGAADRDVSALIHSTTAETGLVRFSSAPGSSLETLAVTATGGYACNEDPANPTVTTNVLPEDILEAWVAEVQREAERRGLFGAAGLRSGDKAKETAAGSLGEDTIEILRTYRRLAY